MRRATPELVQLIAFQRMGILRRATISICVSVIVETIMLTVFFADIALPLAIMAAGAAVSAALFWYAVYLYVKTFRLPHPRKPIPLGG